MVRGSNPGIFVVVEKGGHFTCDEGLEMSKLSVERTSS